MANNELVRTSVEDISNYCVNADSVFSVILRMVKGLQNKEQIENINETLRKYTNSLDFIKDALLDKDFFRKTPVYEEDLLSVLQKAKDEVVEEKRGLYANYLAACRCPDNIECNSKQKYLRIVEHIDYMDVCILNFLNYYRSEKSIIEWVNNNFIKKISPDDILVHLGSIEPLGLIDKIGGEEYEKSFCRRGGNRKLRHPEAVHFYKRNRFGDGFYNFILKGIPNK
jgi:hypothetical protein